MREIKAKEKKKRTQKTPEKKRVFFSLHCTHKRVKVNKRNIQGGWVSKKEKRRKKKSKVSKTNPRQAPNTPQAR